MPDLQSPFSSRVVSGGVVLTFGEYVDQPRTSADDATLDELLAHGDVVCDLSQTRYLASDWLRYLVKLTAKGERMGRRVRLAGVSADVLETADLIAVKAHLKVFATVEEALAP